MRPMLITAPAIEPVSLVEAKSWLREDNNDEDQLIQTLLVSARFTLEAWTRRFFITQGWRLSSDNWPFSGSGEKSILLAFAPFRTVTAIRVYDINDKASVIEPTTYRIRGGDQGGCIRFETPPKTPGRSLDGVEIDFTVGYGSEPPQIPEPLRRAILLLVAHWREHRGDDHALMAFPAAAMALCAPYRRERLT